MHRFRYRILAAMLALTLLSGMASRARAQGSSATPPQNPPSTSDENKEKKDKKDKDKDKDKKKKKQQDDELNTAVFSDAAANDVLGMIRDGLEGHSQRLLLSAFDSDKMDGYLTFEDQIQAMFERYEGFRAHFRILQATTEGNRGIVLAMFEIEELPKGGSPPQRKSSQVRFELERGRKGWRVVDYSPRGFFS
jgi:flagellum-specific peptidoglycan hydrolase FlgJ